MADPKPYVVARWIGSEIRSKDFKGLREVTEEILTRHIAGKSTEEIAELGEALEEDVFNALGDVADQDFKMGIDATFKLEGAPGSAYIRAENTRAGEVLARLRELQPVEFEEFCASVLTALGGNAREVGGTADGGVDFIATEVPIDPFKRPAFRRCCPIVVGQAKRYQEGNLVTVVDMRDFLGGALVKADELKRRDERYGLYSPVTFAFWTTSEFNTSSREFASLAGIWCLGGLALAQVACQLDLAIALQGE